MDWLAVGTFFAGLTSGYTIKAVMNVRSNKNSGGATAFGSSVSQSGNVAGGHVAARDVNVTGK